jgi:hypothetical protein
VGEELFAAFEVRVAVLNRVGLAGDLGVEYFEEERAGLSIDIAKIARLSVRGSPRKTR